MIILRLDRMLAERKISSKELAERVGISQVNMSRIKTGKVSAVRFSTLDAICRALDCQPGDVLEYMPDDEADNLFGLNYAIKKRWMKKGCLYPPFFYSYFFCLIPL
jgi:putative transcriptional regulator